MGGEVAVGLVGAGTISAQYLETFARTERVRVAAVADLDHDRARRVAADAPGAIALSTGQLVADPAIDVVVNLTVPDVHAEVTGDAIAAGRDVWTEKPLALTTADCDRLVDAAAAAGVRVGSAPDTVLGTGTQTARRWIDDGSLGRPVAATAMMRSAGHESWHPDPDFYYRPGGGPLLDMGPYYLSALVHLLGPVEEVVGAGSRARDQRVIGRGPRAGQEVPVTVDTHVTGILRHADGALSTVLFSFDTIATRGPRIEVHGTEASMVVPDPNTFDGSPLVRRRGDDDWTSLPPTAGHRVGGRGIGVIDLVDTAPGLPRASAELARHVVEVMAALQSPDGGPVRLATTVERPPPVPLT